MALKRIFQRKPGMRRNQNRGGEDLPRWGMLCARCLWMLPSHLSPVWPFWILSSEPKLAHSTS